MEIDDEAMMSPILFIKWLMVSISDCSLQTLKIKISICV